MNWNELCEYNLESPRFIVMGSFHPLEAKWAEKHVVSKRMKSAIRMETNSISL